MVVSGKSTLSDFEKAAFSLSPHMAGIPSFLKRVLISSWGFTLMTSPKPNYFSKTPLRNISLWGVGLPHMNRGGVRGDTQSVHNKQTLL